MIYADRNAWQSYLLDCYFFYESVTSRKRGGDYPWHLFEIRESRIKKVLRAIPYLRRFYRMVRGVPAPPSMLDDWLKRDIEQLFEVRCLLSDELSRAIYDNAIILRLVGHGKYYFPRPCFVDYWEELSNKPFIQDGYPHDFLGLPLELIEIGCLVPDNEIRLRMVAPERFVERVNAYRQYIPERMKDRLHPKNGDIVIDCGACIGEFSTIFAGLVGATGRVHIFDPLPVHTKFCELQASLNGDLADVFKVNTLAVSDKTFSRDKPNSPCNETINPSCVSNSDFDTISLDEYVRQNSLKGVDYIKMDIEGAEPEAIMGAVQTIAEFKPRLAISTYHKPEQFWSIPLQIKNINPQYRFMFGHHSPTACESVIYAY